MPDMRDAEAQPDPSGPDRGRLRPDPGGVAVRQWGPRCFAAYVFDGDPFGTFVGTAGSRSAATQLGRRRLRQREEFRERHRQD